MIPRQEDERERFSEIDLYVNPGEVHIGLTGPTGDLPSTIGGHRVTWRSVEDSTFALDPVDHSDHGVDGRLAAISTIQFSSGRELKDALPELAGWFIDNPGARKTGRLEIEGFIGAIDDSQDSHDSSLADTIGNWRERLEDLLPPALQLVSAPLLEVHLSIDPNRSLPDLRDNLSGIATRDMGINYIELTRFGKDSRRPAKTVITISGETASAINVAHGNVIQRLGGSAGDIRTSKLEAVVGCYRASASQ